MTIQFALNGESVTAIVRSGDRLSEILRDSFSLTEHRPDCRTGRCGRCMAFIDERLVPTCLVPAWRAKNKTILTYAGLIASEEGKDILSGFSKSGFYSCGLCLPAKVMTAAELIRNYGHPAERTILDSLSGAWCRCTDPEAWVAAVMQASEFRSKRIYHRADQ